MYAIRSYYAVEEAAFRLALAEVTERVEFLRIGELDAHVREDVPVVAVLGATPDLRIRLANVRLLVRRAVVDQRLGIGTRITSYNVCYTKLLRNRGGPRARGP